MKTKICLLTILAIAATASALEFNNVGAPWYVDPAGNDANDCRTPGTACKTINAAIGKALPGNTVYVAGGTYNEQVVIDKTLTLLGAQAGVDARTRSAVSESIIDNACGPVQIEADNVTLDGFTIQGSTTASPCTTVGIWTSPGNTETHGGHQILNNIVQNNISGIKLENDPMYTTKVQFNLIHNNNIGIVVNSGLENAVIDNNTFSGHVYRSILLAALGSNDIEISNNTLDAGITLSASSDISITGNTSVGNTVDGTIYLHGGNGSVTITDNVLVNGVEAIVSGGDPYLGPNRSVTANNNCISGNSTNGLRVDAGSYTGGSLDATGNNWGAASGPSGTGPGTGDRITDPDGVVDFSSFLTAVDSCPPRGTPAEATSVSVTCDPGSVPIGVPTTCTAIVTNTSATQFYGPPHGTAKFGLGVGPKGTFSPSANCTLTPMGPTFSKCSVTFTPTSGPGTAKVHASYTSFDGPSWKNAGNSPDFLLSVNSDSTKVAVVCTPNSVKVGVSTTCVATVTDTAPTPNNGSPLGTSTFSLGAGVTGNFSGNPCTFVPVPSTNTSTCTMTFTPNSGAGKAKIRANYDSSDITKWGDAVSPDFNLTVTVDSTKVSVACASSSVRLGDSTTCTAAVTDTATSPFGNPVGTAKFSLGAGVTGTFDPPSGTCNLSPADSIISSCSVTFTPASIGKAKVRASYDSGDPTKWADAGNSPDFNLTVPADDTSVSVSCDSPVQVGHATTCTVTVTDTATPYYGSPVGTSKFGLGRGVTGTFSGNPCTLVPALPNTSTCTVTFTPSGAGTARIRANYTSSDSRWKNAGNSPDFSLTVTP